MVLENIARTSVLEKYKNCIFHKKSLKAFTWLLMLFWASFGLWLRSASNEKNFMK